MQKLKVSLRLQLYSVQRSRRSGCTAENFQRKAKPISSVSERPLTFEHINAHIPLTSKTRLLLRGFLNEVLCMSNNLVQRLNHTASQEKYVWFCPLPLSLLLQPITVASLFSVFSLTSVRTSGYRLHFTKSQLRQLNVIATCSKHQYCMHLLRRHSNNLNTCLWPQFYTMIKGKH